MSFELFIYAYIFDLFPSAFRRPTGGTAIKQKLTIWVGSTQSELLCVGNFRGQSVGIADDLLDEILPVRGIVCCSKRYMSIPC